MSSVLKSDMVICLKKVLLLVAVNHDCCNHCHHDVAMTPMLHYCVIMLSLTFGFCMLYCIQVQIIDAGKEETALAVYCMTESVDRC